VAVDDTGTDDLLHVNYDQYGCLVGFHVR
jgi:hypothetical protein